MKVCENGIYRDLTPEEIAEMESMEEKSECEYWLNTPYDEAVNTEIRKQYTESQEFAILRQKDAKPEEYALYFEYCEQCKVFVKTKRAEYGLV